tara:strand:+ start:112637 stop:113341 length:705 start_codon:yes stop_codon:yes gene_type:complete
MKYFILLTSVLLFFNTVKSQELTGEELLANAIKYHDPNNNWESFNGKLSITMEIPNSTIRESEISINLPKEYFYSKATKEHNTTEFILEKNTCKIVFNGNENFSEEIAKDNRLSCDRATLYKNYYTYLYGLPMKLKDPGTIIQDKIERKIFKGKEYLVLKVNYTEGVGKDVWYFYFNPKTYAMEIYQFYHDETKNDGEYIVLSDTKNIEGVNMPKNRAWYTNKENKLLGTDILN